ncbi:hypothetical protein TNCV_2879881 [Trichonephila clavipes]|uniref:Uncharacterized protein n=1 Tax=Trichonephila clavipes TaxID=2585209 RepID=A0A8X6W1S3_TRICX|nr:hypothetical protein TNCV_2879881 [Trichonephila clavipes]
MSGTSCLQIKNIFPKARYLSKQARTHNCQELARRGPAVSKPRPLLIRRSPACRGNRAITNAIKAHFEGRKKIHLRRGGVASVDGIFLINQRKKPHPRQIRERFVKGVMSLAGLTLEVSYYLDYQAACFWERLGLQRGESSGGREYIVGQSVISLGGKNERNS